MPLTAKVMIRPSGADLRVFKLHRNRNHRAQLGGLLLHIVPHFEFRLLDPAEEHRHYQHRDHFN